MLQLKAEIRNLRTGGTLYMTAQRSVDRRNTRGHRPRLQETAGIEVSVTCRLPYSRSAYAKRADGQRPLNQKAQIADRKIPQLRKDGVDIGLIHAEPSCQR